MMGVGTQLRNGEFRMRATKNEKIIYKMYKKGRFWVFAGIAVTTWNVNLLNGQADTVDETSATSSVTSSSATQLSGSTTTLSRSDVTTATSDNSQTATTKADQTTTDDQASSTTKADDAVSETTKTSGSTITDSDNKSTDQSEVSESSNQKEMASSSQTATDRDKTSISQANKTESVDNDSNSSTTTPKDTDTTSSTGTGQVTESTRTITQPVAETTANDGTTPVMDTSDVIADVTTTDTPLSSPATADVSATQQLNQTNTVLQTAIQASAVQGLRMSLMRSTVLATGTYGTSPWTITDDGTLTIGAGALVNSSYISPWFDYYEQITKVVIEPDVVGGTSMSYLFSNLVNVTEFDGLNNIDTSNTQDMSFMFKGIENVTTYDLSSWDVSQVTDMSYMFWGNMMLGSAVTTIKLGSKWNTPRLTNVTGMFQYNNNLTTLDLGSWTADSGSLTQIGGFLGGVQIKTVDLTHFNLSAVTDANSAFEGMSQATSFKFSSGKKLASGVDVTLMFGSELSLTDLDLTGFDMSDISQGYRLLYKNTKLQRLTLDSTTYLTTKGLQTNAELPEIKKTADYSGYWINEVDANNSQAKTYTSAELMAMYDGQNGVAATYIWQAASKASITTQNVTIVAGPKATWMAKDSVKALTDAAGNTVDLATLTDTDVTVSGDQVDPTTAGTYQITLSYGGQSATATVTVVDSQAVLVGQTVSVNQGSKTWQASDSVDQTKSLNADGQALDVTELASVTSSTLDTSKAGAQTVTLTYVDAAGNTVTTDVVVNVIASQAGLVTKNIEIVKGQNATWNVLDNVISATDFNGDAVTDLKTLQLTTSTTPDLTTVGDYPMTLTYTDGEGNAHTYTISVKVIASQVNLAGKDVTVIMGPNANWQVSDSLASATGSDGHALTAAELAKVTTNATLDLTKVGDTEVTLTYTDAAGNTATTTATIHVIKSVAHVNVKDGTIIMGPNATWQAQDNLVSVIQANGDTVAADDVILKNDVQVNSARVMSIMYSYLRADGTTVTVSGQVDLSKIGDNTITYTYTDSQGNTTNSVANVAVVASQAALNANDQTIVQGPNASWNATKAVTVTDEFGQSTAATTVTVGGDTVDLTKAGVYHVTYTYTDGAGNVFTKTIAVTVAATQAGLTTTNSTLIAGPTTKWTVMDNLTAGKDATGQALDLSQVKVSGTVDTTKVGSYPITYTYTDNQGNVVKQTITVTVTKSQAGLTVKDSTLTAGGTWTAADNFVQATDATGQTLTLSAVTVSGQVNTTTAGSYQVTYTYVDAAGNTYTKTATITVQPATDTDDNGGTTTNSDGDGDTVNPGDDGTTVNPDGDGDTINPGTDENTLVNPDGDGDTINPGTTASHGANQQPTVLAKTTVVSAAVVTANKKKVAQLPQTDENQTHNVSALGLTLLALAGVVSWFGIGRKRRHN